MWHPWEPLAHLDTPLLLDVICMNSKVWIDCDRSSWKHLSFKHTPRLLWSRLWQFNLSVVKQFNAPSLSVTLDYCTSHWRDIILFYFVPVSVTLFVCFFAAVFWDTSLLCGLLSYDRPRLRKRLFGKATWTSWNSHKILVHLQLFRMSLELSETPLQKMSLSWIHVSLELLLTLEFSRWVTLKYIMSPTCLRVSKCCYYNSTVSCQL